MGNIINRLVMHHSAGGLTPSSFDLQHYHFMVGGDGKVYKGQHSPEANAIGRKLTSGTYAPHTLNLNGGAIGISLAAMSKANWNNPQACAAFPTRVQVDSFLVEIARLCEKYDIAITRQTVLSHAEVQSTLGITQKGKWDFDYDPYGSLTTRNPVLIGDKLREMIRALAPTNVVSTPVVVQDYPTLRRGSTGPAVAEMQKLLGMPAGTPAIFGPATERALDSFQKSYQLVRDAICGPATWAALLKGKN